MNRGNCMYGWFSHSLDCPNKLPPLLRGRTNVGAIWWSFQSQSICETKVFCWLCSISGLATGPLSKRWGALVTESSSTGSCTISGPSYWLFSITMMRWLSTSVDKSASKTMNHTKDAIPMTILQISPRQQQKLRARRKKNKKLTLVTS